MEYAEVIKKFNCETSCTFYDSMLKLFKNGGDKIMPTLSLGPRAKPLPGSEQDLINVG